MLSSFKLKEQPINEAKASFTAFDRREMKHDLIVEVTHYDLSYLYLQSTCIESCLRQDIRVI